MNIERKLRIRMNAVAAAFLLLPILRESRFSHAFKCVGSAAEHRFSISSIFNAHRINSNLVALRSLVVAVVVK